MPPIKARPLTASAIRASKLGAKVVADRFNPLSIFTPGTDGFWGDTTDSATLFEDATGTTPAQPGYFCGLRLDKSQGGRGADLAVNGDFSSGTTGWTGLNATLSESGGVLTVTRDATYFRAVQAYSGDAGWYEVTFDLVDNGPNLSLDIIASNGANGTGGSQAITTVDAKTPGAKRGVFHAPAAFASVCIGQSSDGGSTFSMDNVTYRKLPGNHQYQPTTAAKPTLQTVNGVQALVLDDDDDSMLIDVPTGGWSGTFVQGTALGVIVGEIDVPAGPYQIPTDPNYAGPGTDIHTFILNRSLVEDELEGLVKWIGKRCPVADFATTSTMNSWFRDRSDITALDFSRANATGVTNMAGLALSTANLATIKLGSIISATTTDIGNLIRGTKLTSLDLSDSVTSGVTSCVNFARGTPLETLTLSGGSGSPFSDSPCVSYSGAFIATNLNQQSYTDLVTAIESAGTSNGTLDITGGTSTTTGAAQAAVDALRGRGWTVTTPDGY